MDFNVHKMSLCGKLDTSGLLSTEISQILCKLTSEVKTHILILRFKTFLIPIVEKKISTENFYDAKSAGYSFGTDLAEKELSERNLHSNIDQFLDELSINYSDLKCNNEG